MKIRKTYLRSLSFFMAIILSVCSFTFVTAAVTDVNGEEMPASAIAISNIDELAMIGYEYPADGYYYLANDIDMTAAISKNGDYYNEGLGWEPIGNQSTPFTGTFNGNGKKIIGLNIGRDTSNHIGLFGYVKNGTIKNLIVENATVQGRQYVSVVAGYSENGIYNNIEIKSCEVDGSLNVGGIVAYEKSIVTVNECINTNCEILGTRFVGGIVGQVAGTGSVLNSVNSGVVYGKTYDSGSFPGYIGGIVGFSDKGVTLLIEGCHNTGTIYARGYSTKDAFAGGIIGAGLSAKVSACYNVGDFLVFADDTNYGGDGERYIGGIAGYIPEIEKCYNLGGMTLIEGKYLAYFGGIIGTSYYSSTTIGTSIKNCFNYNIKESMLCGDASSYEGYTNCYNINGTITSDGGVSNCYYVSEKTSKKGEKRNSRQMKLKSTFVDWDFDTVWTMGGNEDYLYPELQGVPLEYTKALTKISVATEPTKLNYLEQKETLNVSGGSIKLHYDNETTETIPMTPDMISGFDNTAVGTKTVTVTYGGFTTTFDVLILAKTLSAIEIIQKPTKLAYLEAKDTLEVSGGKLKLYYNNDETAEIDIEPTMIKGFDNTLVGPQTLTVEYGGKTDDYEIEIIEKELTGIKVTKLPTKQSYLEAKETLNLTGGKLTLSYNNDTTKEINLSDATVTGFNNKKVGEQTLTVYYQGFTTTFTVNITKKSVSSIVVSTLPDTLVYLEEKDVLNVAGGKITVFYNNGTEEIIDLESSMVSGFNSKTVGNQVLTVTYEGKKAAYEVEVIAKKLESITVTAVPAKTTYREKKDQLNVTGGRITLHYNNETSKTIDMSVGMVTGFDNSKVGKQTLTVTYQGKTASFDIEIIAKTLVSISVHTKPNKTVYLEGEALDITGGLITLYYDNDTVDIVDMSSNMVTGFEERGVGEQLLTITYLGKTTSISVIVKARSVASISLLSAPTKVSYFEKEALDVSGGKIAVVYNNGDIVEIDITPDMISGYNSMNVGEQRLRITFGGNSVEYSVVVAHKYSKKVVAPTCAEQGYTQYTCLICNHQYSDEKTPSTGHTAGDWKTVREATTSKTGLKEKRCTVCNTLLESQSIPKKQATKPSINFVDVKKSDYYYKAVAWAVANNVTSGTTKTTFGPNESCSRAQAVTFLWRAAGSPAPKSSKNPFADVRKSDYYYKAVLWAVENGVTAGTSKTAFSPNEACTRGQIVSFLWRAQSGKKVSAANPFKDVKSGAYYYNAVLWAVKNNVTAGTSATKFSPNETCTRGQIVSFLYRAIVK